MMLTQHWVHASAWGPGVGASGGGHWPGVGCDGQWGREGLCLMTQAASEPEQPGRQGLDSSHFLTLSQRWGFLLKPHL